MINKIYKISAAAALRVYKQNISRGSTQYSWTAAELYGEKINVLSFAGTGGLLDWLWNLCPLTKDGVKFGSYLSAKRAYKNIGDKLKDKKLVVTGHSKAGPTAAYYKLKYGADWCVMFEPARGFLKAPVMVDTTIFIDPDSIVPKLGKFLFKHPICHNIKLPKDKKWYDLFGKIKDHGMVLIKDFVNNLTG